MTTNPIQPEPPISENRMLCASCRSGDHGGHNINAPACDNDNGFNADCRCMVSKEPPISTPESERNDSDRATAATLTSDPVQEARTRLITYIEMFGDRVLPNRLADVIPVMDALIAAAQQEERDRVADELDDLAQDFATYPEALVEELRLRAAALRGVKP